MRIPSGEALSSPMRDPGRGYSDLRAVDAHSRFTGGSLSGAARYDPEASRKGNLRSSETSNLRRETLRP